MIGAQMVDRRELSRLKSSPCEHTPPGRRKGVETTWTCPAVGPNGVGRWLGVQPCQSRAPGEGIRKGA